jgi:hypothetical protein
MSYRPSFLPRSGESVSREAFGLAFATARSRCEWLPAALLASALASAQRAGLLRPKVANNPYAVLAAPLASAAWAAARRAIGTRYGEHDT